MSPQPRGFPAALLLFALALLGGCPSSCGCATPPVTTEECRGITGVQPDLTSSCTPDSGCGDHFACEAVRDRAGLTCCLFADRACTTEADCCPGETCPANRQRCLDKATSCQQDADCGPLKDRFCEVYTDAYGTSRRCRFKPCGPGKTCPEGLACFQGDCLAGLPCGGHCEPGKACVPTIDRCQDYSNPTGRDGAKCPASCAPGFIATFNDGRNLWDACALPQVACVCAELPPLHSHDLGRFSAIAALPGQGLFVSAYDGQYGDLVVVAYELDGGLLSSTWLDGVPDGSVTYGPSGPRGGIEEPGPDVGRYTDIAASADRLYVSYYDVTHGDLKVAIREPTGQWSTQTVDGELGDVGLYSSIALDGHGRPGVAYFQLGAEASSALDGCPAPRPSGAPKLVTALKFARAKTPTPSGPGDWVVKSLSCLASPASPCDGCSGTCALVNARPACLSPASGCPTCTGAQACVSLNGTPTCATRSTSAALKDVPLGVGVFASLAFRQDEALIAAMRRAETDAGTPKGELVGFTVAADNSTSGPVVLDATGDTGFHPDVAIEPASGRIAVGYHDFTSKAFKLYLGSIFRSGVQSEIIDSGKDGSGTESFVGTDSAILFGGDGGMLAVYQDATHGDLKLARRAGTWTVEGPLSSAGAVGFFADAVLLNGAVHVSHARLKAVTVNTTLRLETSLLLEQLPP